MSSIKIAFFHNKFPLWGAEKITDIISEQLNKIGYEVYIFASNFDFSTSPQKLSGANYITLPSRIGSSESQKFIINRIKDLGVDISIFCGGSAADMQKVRDLTTSRVIYMLHTEPAWKLKYKVAYEHFNRRRSVGRCIRWYVLQWPKYCLFNTLKSGVAGIHTEIYNSVDIFGVLCQGYVETMETELGVKSVESKFRAIYNPAVLLEEPIMSKRKRVLFVGRLTYADKRVDRLLYAWGKIYKSHPDWELHIVGSGEDEEYFKRVAQELKLENTKFLGYSKDPIVHYRDAAILCLTSATEGVPNVLYEAQMYGVVPIAINCCKGIEELLSPSGVNGILVDGEDNFADELSKLMSDEPLRAAIQQSAYESIKQYSLDVVVKNWDTLIRGLVLDKK